MLKRWFHLTGLLAVLLALTVQIGLGASVPPMDSFAGAAALCHPANGAAGAPAQTPNHHTDCLVCPLCGALHAQAAAVVSNPPLLPPPGSSVFQRPKSPPPSTAPPSPHRPPSQPRAPPIFS